MRSHCSSGEARSLRSIKVEHRKIDRVAFIALMALLTWVGITRAVDDFRAGSGWWVLFPAEVALVGALFVWSFATRHRAPRATVTTAGIEVRPAAAVRRWNLTWSKILDLTSDGNDEVLVRYRSSRIRLTFHSPQDAHGFLDEAAELAPSLVPVIGAH